MATKYGEDEAEMLLVEENVPPLPQRRWQRQTVVTSLGLVVAAFLVSATWIHHSTMINVESVVNEVAVSFISTGSGKWCQRGNILRKSDGNSINPGPVANLQKCQESCSNFAKCKELCYDSKNRWCSSYTECGSPLKRPSNQACWIKKMEASTPTLPSPPRAPPLPRGAKNGDANPWPNIYLATLGYNLYYGDPLPMLNPKTNLKVHQNIMDPGLTKPLFLIEYTQRRKTSDGRHTQPDGFHATMDMGCSTIFTTKTIRDAYDYQSDQQQKVGLSARVEAAVKFPPAPGKKKSPASKVTVGVSGKAFARAGGTLSYQWRDIQSQNTLRDQKMYRTAAKCSSYVVAYSFASPPKAHPDFQGAVNKLSSSSSFYRFFDEYGTHFLTAVRMGARYGSSIFVENSKANDMQKTADGFGLTLDLSIGAVAKVGVGYKGMSAGLKKVAKLEAKIPLITPKEKLAAQEFKRRFVKKQTNSVIGPPLPMEGVGMWHQEVQKNPVPMQWESSPICMHPSLISNDVKYKACIRYMESYCDGHLKKKGAKCVPAAEKECYNDLDCKDDFVCRQDKCVAVPECKVTLYRDKYYRGGSYQLETVTAIKHMGGKLFDLKNGNWYDSISSFRMSDGCLKVEAIDDDNKCALGKGDNGRYTSSVNKLPYDLDNDVCKMKVWAKPPPDVHFGEARGKYLGGYTRTVGSRKITDVDQAKATCLEVSDCAGITCKGSACTLRTGKELKRSPQGEVTWFLFEKVSGGRRLGELDSNTTAEQKLWFQEMFNAMEETPNASDVGEGALHMDPLRQRREAASSSNVILMGRNLSQERDLPEVVQESEEPNSPARRLHANNYLRNIGKAMYGYNHYFGAPSSAENAGTDPGFVHRPLWKSRYTRGTVVTEQTFNAIPNSEQALSGAGVSGKASSGAGVSGTLFAEVRGQYLSGHTRAVGSKRFSSLLEAKDKCIAVKECMGITCSRSRCTLRSGRELKNSPSGEITWFKLPSDSFAQAYQQYLGGYTRTTGSRKFGNVNEAKKRCLTTTDCTGITCSNRRRSSCTLRKGKDLRKSPQKENTWFRLSSDSRRLSGLLVSDDSSYVLGPGRRLAAKEKVPDGWKVTKAARTICDKDFATKEIKSLYDYEKEESSSLNPLGLKLDLGMFGLGFTFSLSSEATEFRKSNAKSRKAMYKTSAECMDYIAELDLRNPPPTSDNLQFVVAAAGEEHEFHSVFDMFGLHFPTTIIFGAKYGFTQNIDESSWSQVSKHSSSFSVGAEVTKQIKIKKGISPKVSLSATAGASYSEKEQESESQQFDSYFSEVKEFSLGRAMPNKGGVHEWVKIVDGEPMPIRYALKSICEHPAFASKKADCTKYSKTYCTSHLQKSMGGGVNCDRAQKQECLWDLDCPPHHTCTEFNSCLALPSCTVWLYAEPNYRGSVRTFGPLYRREAPMGKVYDTWDKAKIDSVKISGGCEEVLLMDADAGGCLERRDDNHLMENRKGNGEKRLSNLPYDLEDDVCSIKLKTKEKWL